jgi:hypothetical protein
VSGFLANFLGSGSAEAALLHLFHYGETYGRAVASDMEVALQPVQRQLDRLEQCGVLVSREAGQTRLYSWNPKSPFTPLLREMVKVQYEAIPLEKRQVIFQTRRRPRAKGKPVISSAGMPVAE